MEFDLLHLLKETQLQHGLRAEDYARYHRYTTNRISTLRRQLGLVHDSKKFQPKDITPQNATRPEHLQLLALHAERCWAAAEEQQAQLRAAARGNDHAPPGGLPPNAQHRKRLNKASRWAARLQSVAAVVAGDRLRSETAAYALETRGRAAAAKGHLADAKSHFAAARAGYDALRACSGAAQWPLLAAKLTELDDRVLYCMLRLGEDTAAYRPPGASGAAPSPLPPSAGGGIRWNGRHLTMASIRVRDALREARDVAVEASRQRALDAVGAVPIGQQSRVLDLMDRRIGRYNDALAHARQELRGLTDERQRTETQLLLHYLLFHAARATLERTRFLVEVYARRFRATERCLEVQRARGRREIPPSQFASPLEVVRLCDAALETVAEMELLPGAAAEVAETAALCRAERLYYVGESWRIAGDAAEAQRCFAAAGQALERAESASPEFRALGHELKRSALRLAASTLLRRSGPSTECPMYLVGAGEQVAVAQNVIKFPPDYQAIPCKPVFVDIASTYVDYPQRPSAGDAALKEQQPQRGETKSGKDEKGWKWGWGWRK